MWRLSNFKDLHQFLQNNGNNRLLGDADSEYINKLGPFILLHAYFVGPSSRDFTLVFLLSPYRLILLKI